MPVFNRVDTCAAEFESTTPYLYSCYETEDEAETDERTKVVVLGSGPNRIGQGLEFDYCCVHAAGAISEAGFESVMVNCNPETVSTDYDTSDRLYFEPLTIEDVLAVVEREKPLGVLVQFGGQTPLKLARPLEKAGVRILGTSPEAIDRAEDRQRFGELLADVGLQAPPWAAASSPAEGMAAGRSLGFPLLVRPSYVLGGRAMRIAYDERTLERILEEALAAFPDRPVLIDRFLEDAFELDVDALGDGTEIVIAGVMQHIEEAGIHSGDSYAVLPPYRRVPRGALGEIRDATAQLGKALKVVGLMNVQYAIKDGQLFVLEVNPRASRTVPFVAKATGVPFARLATRLCLGESLRDVGLTEEPPLGGFSIKAPVFPFRKFEGVDTILGPEMRSTGEVMGHDRSFGLAFLKAALGAGIRLPEKGTAFLSVHDGDKEAILPIARELRVARLLAPRDVGDGTGARRRGTLGRHGPQGERGAPEHRRPDDQRRGGARHQHAARPRVVLRRDHDPPDGAGARHSLPDDALGGLGRDRGDPRPRRRRPFVRPASGGGPGLSTAAWAAGAVLAAVGAYLGLRRPDDAPLGLVFLAPLLPGVARLLGGDLPLLFFYAAPALAASLAVRRRRDEPSPLPRNVLRWSLAFLLVAAVSSLSSIVRGETLWRLLHERVVPHYVNGLWMTSADRSRGAVLTFLGYLLLLAALDAFSRLVADPVRRRRLLAAASAGGALALAAAVLEPAIPSAAGAERWAAYLRYSGTFTDPNALGIGAALLAILALALLLEKAKGPRLARIPAFVVLILALPALQLSGSRTGFLLLATAGALLLAGLVRAGAVPLRRLGLGVAAALLLAAVVWPLLPKRGNVAKGGLAARLGAALRTGSLDATANKRLVFWRGALDVILEEPLSGCGLGGFPYEFPVRFGQRHHPVEFTDNATNALLDVGAECGLPALVLALAAAIPVLVRAFDAALARRRSPWDRASPAPRSSDSPSRRSRGTISGSRRSAASSWPPRLSSSPRGARRRSPIPTSSRRASRGPSSSCRPSWPPSSSSGRPGARRRPSGPSLGRGSTGPSRWGPAGSFAGWDRSPFDGSVRARRRSSFACGTAGQTTCR